MQETIWNKLLEFETRDLVERFIKRKYNRDASARQVLEITSNFIQGREYFRNARQAAISVKPLLLYYGVASLARGLILALAPHRSEASFKPAHGLDTIDWQAALASKDFGKLTVSITAGSFHDLLTTTENRSYFKHNSSFVVWPVNFNIPELGTKIQLSDLLNTLPDLSDEFEAWSERPLAFAKIESFRHFSASEDEYTFSNSVTPETLKAIFPGELYNALFPEKSYGEFVSDTTQNKIRVIAPSALHPQFSQMFRDPFNAGLREVVVTKSIDYKTHLNTLSQLYCLSYFFGMLARYFPSVWISLGRTEKGDAIYPLVIRSVDFIEKHFAELVLEFLAGPYELNKQS